MTFDNVLHNFLTGRTVNRSSVSNRDRELNRRLIISLNFPELSAVH